MALDQPVESITAAAGGAGYWLLGSDGGVFTYCGAAFDGSDASVQTPSGSASYSDLLPRSAGGYWLVGESMG